MRRDGELAARKEEENLDRMLKTQEWREIKKQQQEERNEQRKSIAKRLAESNRQQELSLAKHRETLDALHLDLELKRIGK